MIVKTLHFPIIWICYDTYDIMYLTTKQRSTWKFYHFVQDKYYRYHTIISYSSKLLSIFPNFYFPPFVSHSNNSYLEGRRHFLFHRCQQVRTMDMTTKLSMCRRKPFKNNTQNPGYDTTTYLEVEARVSCTTTPNNMIWSFVTHHAVIDDYDDFLLLHILWDAPLIVIAVITLCGILCKE